MRWRQRSLLIVSPLCIMCARNLFGYRNRFWFMPNARFDLELVEKTTLGKEADWTLTQDEKGEDTLSKFTRRCPVNLNGLQTCTPESDINFSTVPDLGNILIISDATVHMTPLFYQFAAKKTPQTMFQFSSSLVHVIYSRLKRQSAPIGHQRPWDSLVFSLRRFTLFRPSLSLTLSPHCHQRWEPITLHLPQRS